MTKESKDLNKKRLEIAVEALERISKLPETCDRVLSDYASIAGQALHAIRSQK